jgi:hypothetical protein
MDSLSLSLSLSLAAAALLVWHWEVARSGGCCHDDRLHQSVAAELSYALSRAKQLAVMTGP